MALDTKKLALIMGMTGSAHDNEALTALRKANAMLKEADVSWSDVLHRPTLGMPVAASPDYRTPPSKRRGTASYGRPTSQRPTEDTTRHTGDDIDRMLSFLGEQRHDMSTMMMLASIREHWERKSYLTTPQYETIKRMSDASSGNRGRGDRWRF
jgi:hypothetical protein